MTKTKGRIMKSKRINITVGDVLKRNLKEVSDSTGLTISEIIRRGIVDQIRELNRFKNQL